MRCLVTEDALLLARLPTVFERFLSLTEVVDRPLILLTRQVARLVVQEFVDQGVDDVFDSTPIDADLVRSPRLKRDPDERTFGHCRAFVWLSGQWLLWSHGVEGTQAAAQGHNSSISVTISNGL